MNTSIVIYVLSFGLAIGLFQNCTKQQFAAFSSTAAGRQGATNFDPPSSNSGGSTDPGGSGGSGDGGSPTIVGTLEAKATPPVIDPGSSAVVSVKTSNVDRIEFVCAVASDLSAAGVFRQGSLKPGEDSFVLAPTQTSACRITGYGAKLSGPVVADVSVVVQSPGTVVGTLVITATPSSVAPGQSTTLRAEMTHVTAVTYACAAGRDVSGAVFQQGELTPSNASFTLAPAQTSTCKFIGTGPKLAGPIVQTLTVGVDPAGAGAGELEVTANPPVLDAGQSTVVTARMVDLDAVSFTCALGADGSGLVFLQSTLMPANPSFAIAPSETSLCRFTGRGANLAAPITRTLTLLVNRSRPVVGSFAVDANPTTLERGQISTITASALRNVTSIGYACSADATGVVFAQGDLTLADPSARLSPTQTSTCVFTGRGPELAAPVTKSIRLTVTDPPPVLVTGSFDVSASKSPLTRGESTTITAASIQNLSSISYACSHDASGAVVAQGILTTAESTFALTPDQTVTCNFTGVGQNLAGPVTRALRVEVSDPPAPTPAQKWTWHGLLYQTTCSPRTRPNCDSVEWATCEGTACRAPKIQCYAATPWGVPVHPEGVTQTTEPNGLQCYLRQSWGPWIYR